MFGLDLVKTAKNHLNNKESIKLYFYVNHYAKNIKKITQLRDRML